MNLTKLAAGTASNYYTNTSELVVTDHGGTMADYYDAAGTPPGTWLGKGVETIGMKDGQTASKDDVSRLFDELRNPRNDMRMGRSNREAIQSGRAVSGYDLTFTMPKGVNIIWAAGDENTRKTIMRCHREAVRESLDWFENNEAYAREGAQGLAKVRAKGITAVSFTHWDTRDHDPHLHDHVLVSNFVERPDGSIGALDGRSLYHSAVRISEMHANLLMDKLTDRLGVTWRSRETGEGKAAVWDVEGIDDRLIDRFSQRRGSVERRKREITAKAREEGKEPSPRTQRRIDREAWNDTRKAKPEEPMSLNELMEQWKAEMRLMGVEPKRLTADVCGRDHTLTDMQAIAASPDAMRILSGLLSDSVHDQGESASPFARFRKEVEEGKATISSPGIRAAAERLTRGIRADHNGREQLIELLSTAEEQRLIELTPARYRIDAEMRHDTAITGAYGRAVTDTPEGRLFASPELIDAEHTFQSIADHTWQPAGQWTPHTLASDLEHVNETTEHPLAPDQQAAVARLLSDRHAITGLTGAAGTGKTTTLNAVAKLVAHRQGEGLVIGIAPTAAAAGELGNSLGIGADTMAKVLDEAANHRIAGRLETAQREYAQTPADNPRRRQELRESIAGLTAQRTRLTIPEHGVVILDEAGMADTFSAARLAQLCADKDAKLIMVGDPQQLDTPSGASGAFAWLTDHDRAARLDSVWRFHDPEEARRSLELRDNKLDTDGHSTAIASYRDAGRIHTGGTGMAGELAERMADDIQHGTDSMLITGSNTSLAKLNEQVSKSLARRGITHGPRVRLSDGSTAAAGDLIATRLNRRTLATSKGGWVRNNDLWAIDRVTATGLEVHRKGDSADTVTLPREYVEEQTVGGYALTAHRAQGKTVDRAYYYLPLDTHADAAGLYVGLTRGHGENQAWVETKSTTDMLIGGRPTYELAAWRQANRSRLEAEGKTEWKDPTSPCPRGGAWYVEADLDPTPMQQAVQRLETAAGDRRRNVFATQTGEEHRIRMHSLERLGAEHDYYVQVCAERMLEPVIGHGAIMRHHDETTWRQMLSAYAEADALGHGEEAAHLVAQHLGHGSAEARTMIRRDITDADSPVRDRWQGRRWWRIEQTESLPEGPRAAAQIANQATDLIEQALDTKTEQATDPKRAPQWAMELGPAPVEGSVHRRQWESLVREESAYRAARHIDDNAPLGADHTHDGWRPRLDGRLDDWKRSRSNGPEPDSLETIDGGGASPIRAGAARAIRAGAAPLIDTGTGTAGKTDTGQVCVGTGDPAAALTAVRRISRDAVAKTTIAGIDDEQCPGVWKALTPRERGMVQTITTQGTVMPLWQRMTALAKTRKGIEGVQEIIDGLDERQRIEAIHDINTTTERTQAAIHDDEAMSVTGVEKNRVLNRGIGVER